MNEDNFSSLSQVSVIKFILSGGLKVFASKSEMFIKKHRASDKKYQYDQKCFSFSPISKLNCIIHVSLLTKRRGNPEYKNKNKNENFFS